MKEYIAELEQYEKMTTVHDLSLATQGKAVVPLITNSWLLNLTRIPKSAYCMMFASSRSLNPHFTLLFQGVICSSVEIFLPFQQRHMQNSWKFLNEQFRRKHKVMAEEFSGVQDV